MKNTEWLEIIEELQIHRDQIPHEDRATPDDHVAKWLRILVRIFLAKKKTLFPFRHPENQGLKEALLELYLYEHFAHSKRISKSIRTL